MGRVTEISRKIVFRYLLKSRTKLFVFFAKCLAYLITFQSFAVPSVHFVKSSNMPTIWQNMTKSLVQLALKPHWNSKTRISDTRSVTIWSNYLGLEVLDTVEHVMPFPCLCVVAAGGVGHGMVVILPNPIEDWVVGIPSPAILCPRCWVGWKNNMYIRIYNQIFRH